MEVSRNFSRSRSWVVRLIQRLPGAGLTVRIRAARIMGDKAHVYEPSINGREFARRQFLRAVHAFFRRLKYRSAPSEPGRSALILGQTLRMLETAEKVLSNYREGVLRGDKLPPLDLIDRVKTPLLADNGETLDYLFIAVDRAPNYAEAWCELGRVLLEDGAIDEALAAFRMVPISASYADPDRQPENIFGLMNDVTVKAWYWMGHAHERRDEPAEAIAAYLEALLIQPNCPIVCRALAALQYERGAVLASMEYWGPAMVLHPIVVALPLDGRDLTTLPSVIASHLKRVRPIAPAAHQRRAG